MKRMMQNEESQRIKKQIQVAMQRLRKGENVKALGNVPIVGATLISSTFECLDNFEFPIVILDEACQQTEPSSLLALARFGARKLIMVGDPKQLKPTIDCGGADASHDQGLEQTLFHRLQLCGVPSVMLRTQYRYVGTTFIRGSVGSIEARTGMACRIMYGVGRESNSFSGSWYPLNMCAC